mmetsp:Transcript_6921/g.17697  ORF Transcript_6921/g.17697 Transcript_6921/m.17697 type:complete len:211 (-) Transcript_6921:184-816(-)
MIVLHMLRDAIRWICRDLGPELARHLHHLPPILARVEHRDQTLGLLALDAEEALERGRRDPLHEARALRARDRHRVRRIPLVQIVWQGIKLGDGFEINHRDGGLHLIERETHLVRRHHRVRHALYGARALRDVNDVAKPRPPRRRRLELRHERLARLRANVSLVDKLVDVQRGDVAIEILLVATARLVGTSANRHYLPAFFCKQLADRRP